MDKEKVKALAKLARIEISDTEAEKLSGEFEAILGYVGEVKVASASHKASADRGKSSIHNVLREDTNPHEAGVNTEALLKEAPSREGDYIKVKNIL